MKDDYVDLAERLTATAAEYSEPLKGLLLEAAGLLLERGEQADFWKSEAHKWENRYENASYEAGSY